MLINLQLTARKIDIIPTLSKPVTISNAVSLGRGKLTDSFVNASQTPNMVSNFATNSLRMGLRLAAHFVQVP